MTNITDISCGGSWALATTQEGKLISWGSLSITSGWPHTVGMPQGLTNVCQINASPVNGVVVLDDGTPRGWGDTIYYQVGFPEILRNVVQTYLVPGVVTLLVTGDSRVFESGFYVGPIHEFSEPKEIVEVVATQDRILGRRRDGSVAIWGHGGFASELYQPLTNVPPNVTNVVGLAITPAQNLALRADGTVIRWGTNYLGGVNVPGSVTGAVAIAASPLYEAALLSDGRPIGLGSYGVPNGLKGVVAISVGGDAVLGLVDDEVEAGLPALIGPPCSLVTPGQPFELLLKSFNSPTTVSVEGLPDGLRFSLARNSIVGVTDAVGSFLITLQAENAAGSTTRQLTLKAVLPPPHIVTPPIQELTVGVENVLKLTVYGQPTEWTVENLPPGVEFEAATATIRGIPTQLGNYPVRLRASNDAGTNELMMDARVSNLAIWPTIFFESFENHTPVNLGAVIQGVVGNDGHILAIMSDGSVQAWGRNNEGQTNVPDGLSAVNQLAVGRGSSLALLKDGSIVGWGSHSAVIPSGNWQQIASSWEQSFAVDAAGQVSGWGDFSSSPWLQPGIFPGPVRAVSASNTHALAALNDGTVYGWGLNGSGQIVPPSGLRSVVQVAAGESFSLVLQTNGKVVGWGWGELGQTNVPDGLDDVAMIAAGMDHALALREDGTVAHWGYAYPEDDRISRMHRVRWIDAKGGMRFVVVRAPGDDEIVILRQPRASIVRSVRQERVQFSVGAVGQAPLRFQWQFGGLDLPGETNRWLNVDRVAPCHLGPYSVRISDGFSEVVASTELSFEGVPPLPEALELDEFFQLGICVTVATQGARLTHVQVSDNLIDWHDLILLPPSAVMFASFVDPISPKHGRRFYRLTWNE